MTVARITAVALLCSTLLSAAHAALPPYITGFRGLDSQNCTGRRVTNTLMSTSEIIPAFDFVSVVRAIVPPVNEFMRATYNATDDELRTFRGWLLTDIFPNYLNVSVDPQLVAANNATGVDSPIPVNITVQNGRLNLGLWTPSPEAASALAAGGGLSAASLTNPPAALLSPQGPNAFIAPWSRNSSVAPLFGTLTGYDTIDPTELWQLTEGGMQLTTLQPINVTGAFIIEYPYEVMPPFSIWLWSLAQMKETAPPAGSEPRLFQYYWITPAPKLPSPQSVQEIWEWNTAAPAGIEPLGAGHFVGATIAQPHPNGTRAIERYIYDMTGPPLTRQCTNRPPNFFGSASFNFS